MGITIVTGTPGTGKTTLAKEISKKLNYEYVDVNKLIKKYKISGGYDRKRKSKMIDIKKLNRVLIKEIKDFELTNKKSIIKKINNKVPKKNKIKKIKRGVVIDSHLSHYLPKGCVDLCIVTKCDLKVLEKRLKKRGYNKNKVRENIDAEIFDICLNEALERKHNMIVIDLTKGIKRDHISKIENEVKSTGRRVK